LKSRECPQRLKFLKRFRYPTIDATRIKKVMPVPVTNLREKTEAAFLRQIRTDLIEHSCHLVFGPPFGQLRSMRSFQSRCSGSFGGQRVNRS
jgi:hypothetical protein